MGGKNGLIIDHDADLDEALSHIIESAFGYQGQKCSAASRLILLEDIHDVLLERLVEAARSLKIGPPEDPRNFIGPVIDAAAQSKIQGYIDLGKREGEPLQHRMWVYFNVDFRHPPSDVISVIEDALTAAPIEGVADEPKAHAICMDFARDTKDSYAYYAARYWLTDLAKDDPTSSRVRERIYAALKLANIPLAVPAARCVGEIARDGSAEARWQALDLLTDRGATSITVLCALAAPEGLRRLEESGLPLRVFTASVDEGLNEKAYIVPGLGDAGDRQFGAV